MKPVIKQLRAVAASVDSFALGKPVVRVQARFGNTWAAWGSGFLIGQWPSSVITARHVVALPQGIAPADVRVEGFVGGTWTRFDVASIAFLPAVSNAEDVAIVRIHGTCPSGLQAGTIEGPCRAEIWGYPLGAAPTSGLPVVTATRALPAPGRIRLERPGRPGMSGGPVIAISDAGVPMAAIGIYLGTSPAGARANALISDAVFACKDAAMDSLGMAT